jgi:hypothetical protein
VLVYDGKELILLIVLRTTAQPIVVPLFFTVVEGTLACGPVRDVGLRPDPLGL